MRSRTISFNTRPVSLLLIAALAGVGLWLFQPWARAQSAAPNAQPARASLLVDGTVQTTDDGGVIRRLVVPLALDGAPGISLDGARLQAETEMSASAAASVPAGYTLNWLDGNGDDVIDAGEHVELVVDLPQNTSVHPGNPLTLVFKTPDGGRLPLVIQK
ncbi:MAG: hypothetical protein IVW36_00355 [Dehalococcoidia bacterium]|nr:hypothetical protein [Dehalococcoidia bacterium]